MSKRCIRVAVALVAWLASAPGFAASDKEKDKPKASPEAATKEAAPKKEAEPVSGEPQLTTASFGDWVERCQRLTGPGEVRKVCEVALTVTASGQNGQTSPLAEIAIGRVKKTDPLRLTLVLPVNVGFPSAPKLDLEGQDAIDLVWRQCVPAGCFADAAFGTDQQSALRDAKSAKVESKAAGGQAFNFAVSLRGLPQALDALAREP
jgi:invasion protein IalB